MYCVEVVNHDDDVAKTVGIQCWIVIYNKVVQ